MAVRRPTQTKTRDLVTNQRHERLRRVYTAQAVSEAAVAGRPHRPLDSPDEPSLTSLSSPMIPGGHPFKSDTGCTAMTLTKQNTSSSPQSFSKTRSLSSQISTPTAYASEQWVHFPETLQITGCKSENTCLHLYFLVWIKRNAMRRHLYQQEKPSGWSDENH